MRNQSVALIMTLFNEKKDLPALLNSIDHQSLAPDEIIICDNGSTDGTLRILHDWQETLPLQVTIIERSGVNIAAGRNAAIRAAASAIICVTDGSCILHSDWLKEITGPLRSGDERTGIVYGDTVAIGESRIGKLFARLHSLKTAGRVLSDSAHSSRSVAFRKSAWETVGGYPEWMTLAGEDTYFFTQMEKISDSQCAAAAKAYWHHGEESLGKIFHRHQRNSAGDGEANLWPVRYLILLGIYLLIFSGLLLALLSPVWLPFTLALLLVIVYRHTPAAINAKTPLIDTFTLLPAITFFRDLGMVAGYLIGLKRRLSKRLSGTSVET